LIHLGCYIITNSYSWIPGWNSFEISHHLANFCMGWRVAHFKLIHCCQ